MGGNFVCRGEYKLHTYDSSIGKSEGKRWLGRPKHKWEDNIKN